MKRFIAIAVVACFLGGMLLSSPIFSLQEKTDPFYLVRLREGEQAFLEGRYEDALRDLKIALFGLQGAKELRAKASVYLSLCHYAQKNTPEAEKCLKDAVRLVGVEGLKGLGIEASTWTYLDKMLGDFGLAPQQSSEQQRQSQRAQAGMERAVTEMSEREYVRSLERRIKSEPQNVDLYYDLYTYYMQNDRPKDARRILETLIKKNPDEARAYYLLGKTQYQERRLKTAEKTLEKVFKLQARVPVEEYVLLEAMAYQIVGVYLQGERDKAYRMFAEWASQFTPERIRLLDMGEKERAVFEGIAASEAVKAEIARLASEKPQEMETEESPRQEGGGATAAQPREDASTQKGDLVPLSLVDTPPVIKKRVEPKYPATAYNLRIEGRVVLNVLISEEGDVTQAVVIRGLGGGISKACIEAVMQWKFAPAVKDGVPVKVWKPITIAFKR